MADVTVIITVYNRSDLLQKALLSVASQRLPPWELVVSDDGSDEDIVGVLRRCRSWLPCGVTYVGQPDRGFRLAKSRNNAIREATGDVLVFLDQDIVSTNGYLAVFGEEVRPGRFVVAYPVRLSEAQTELLSDEMIRAGCFESILTRAQLRKVRRQFVKDRLYHLGRRYFRLGGYRLKLRGGVFGVRREDIVAVDGFDENYQAWGGEDDDLGRRLYAAGLTGLNCFLGEYPLHLHHQAHHDQGARLNQPYARRRVREVRHGDILAVRGLSKPLIDEHLEIIRLP
jgi:glycosyltransferase involved in cell wall biosynthesis